jgi:hypothetical protein
MENRCRFSVMSHLRPAADFFTKIAVRLAIFDVMDCSLAILTVASRTPRGEVRRVTRPPGEIERPRTHVLGATRDSYCKGMPIVQG